MYNVRSTIIIPATTHKNTKSYSSSTYWTLMGTIIAKGIDSMALSLSSIHWINGLKNSHCSNNQNRRRILVHGKGHQKPNMALQDNYLKKNVLLCILLMRFCLGEKRRRKKNPSPIIMTLRRFGCSLNIVYEVVWIEQWQKEGKWIIDSNYTDLRVCSLCDSPLLGLVTLDPFQRKQAEKLYHCEFLSARSC